MREGGGGECSPVVSDQDGVGAAAEGAVDLARVVRERRDVKILVGRDVRCLLYTSDAADE